MLPLRNIIFWFLSNILSKERSLAKFEEKGKVIGKISFKCEVALIYKPGNRFISSKDFSPSLTETENI